MNVHQHPYNTRNRPLPENLTPTTSDQDRNNKSQKNPNQNHQSTPSLEYNVIDDLRKLKANISVFELLKNSRDTKTGDEYSDRRHKS